MAGRIFTPEETARQLATVERAMVDMWAEQRIINAARTTLNIGAARVRTIMARIRARWAEEESRARESNKASAIRRLARKIEETGGRRDPNDPTKWAEKPDFGANVRYESLLADLQGTREPLQINLDVRMTQALVGVVAGLTPEQLADIMEENLRLERDAEAYRLQRAVVVEHVNGVTDKNVS